MPYARRLYSKRGGRQAGADAPRRSRGVQLERGTGTPAARGPLTPTRPHTPRAQNESQPRAGEGLWLRALAPSEGLIPARAPPAPPEPGTCPAIRHRQLRRPRPHLGVQQVVVGHEDDVGLLLQVPRQVVGAHSGGRGGAGTQCRLGGFPGARESHGLGQREGWPATPHTISFQPCEWVTHLKIYKNKKTKPDPGQVDEMVRSRAVGHVSPDWRPEATRS